MAVVPKAAEQAHQQADTGKPKSERKPLGPGSLAGNLTRDPELRYTPNGRAVCSMRVAVTPREWNERKQLWEDGQTQFYDVSAWAQLAEHCAEYLVKGQRIVAEGEWESRSWEGKEGDTMEAVGLVARDLGPSMLFIGARLVTAERAKK